MKKKKRFFILISFVLIMMTLFPYQLVGNNENVTASASENKQVGKGKNTLPQLSPAQPGTLQSCLELLSFNYDSTTITSAEMIQEGQLSNAGNPVGEHCLIKGKMHERTSSVDGQTYAIGFEMRLPTDWAGRFLYQANGGLDGNVASAFGNIGGVQLENGIQMGFVVLSSDAGHNGKQNPLFGIDPQARLDYGYQAVGKLTPMAKNLIKEAYGREPDRSYIAGGSNGGRHTMVAAARYADQYDGFLAVAPGFNLPQAAGAQIWGAQQWAKVATDIKDLNTALPVKERQLVAEAILNTCDGLDRLIDGMVQDSERCQKIFDIEKDVPTCKNERDGSCLTQEQKKVIKDVFAGARTSTNEEYYASFPFDPGIVHDGWASWKFGAAVSRDPMASGFIFSTPPEDAASFFGKELDYVMNYDLDTQGQLIYESNNLYKESAMEFMTPPNPTKLDTLRNTGAKMIVVHGASDGVFSVDDTARWYEALDANYKNKADEFVRYFEVTGMGHVSGGPSTDQYDGLGSLIQWVEYGEAPEQIIATARGKGNAASVNPDVPSTWASDRSRPLCPYPSVARYTKGNPEVASSFACKPN